MTSSRTNLFEVEYLRCLRLWPPSLLQRGRRLTLSKYHNRIPQLIQREFRSPDLYSEPRNSRVLGSFIRRLSRIFMISRDLPPLFSDPFRGPSLPQRVSWTGCPIQQSIYD